MKKLTIVALMPALFVTAFSGYAAAPAVTVDGGKINFEGAVVAAPCAVDNTTDGQTVSMGQIPASHLAAYYHEGDRREALMEIVSCHFHRTIFKLTSLISFGQRGLHFSHGFSFKFYLDASLNQSIQDGIGMC